MPRFLIFGFAFVILSAAFLGFQMLTSSPAIGQTYEWRQRITVTVETPAGEVQGTAVTEVQILLMSDFFAGDIGGAKHNHWGEAAIVDLGQERYLFALLDGVESWVINELSTQGFDGGVPELSDIFRRLDAPLVLSQRRYPTLVTFTDINDPMSVMSVDPDDLATSFGDGFNLKEITMEISKEPVTHRAVDRVLGTGFFREWAKIKQELMSEPGWRDRYVYFETPSLHLTRNDFIKSAVQ